MVNYTDAVGGKTKKERNRRKTTAKPARTHTHKITKGMSLECNSNNNNSTGTNGMRHSVDDEAELVQNDEISKTILIT